MTAPDRPTDVQSALVHEASADKSWLNLSKKTGTLKRLSYLYISSILSNCQNLPSHNGGYMEICLSKVKLALYMVRHQIR